MPPAAVLFDLDGVLIDSRPVWFELLDRAARHFGHPSIPRAVFDASFGQGVEADARDFFGGMPPAELEAWFDAHFMDHAAGLVIEPDAGAVFRALATRGIATAVVTNSSRALAAEIARAAGFEPDVLVAAGDAPLPKPAPDPVLEACRGLGVAPAAAWLVGDSRFDRDSAAAAGVHFVGYRIEGDRRIERLSELLLLDGS